MNAGLTRNTIVVRLGTPDRTEGSLNSPVELEEQGLQYNEKWLYEHLVDDPSLLPQRVIYWHRYDFIATMVRAGASDAWLPDDTLAASVRPADPRLMPLADQHQAEHSSQVHRPVSEVRNAADLGGYIQGLEKP